MLPLGIETAGTNLTIVGIANEHLRPFSQTVALCIASHVHGRLGAARTDILNFFDALGQCQEHRGAGKWHSSEIGSQPEAQHRHTELMHSTMKLAHLFLCQELRLVNQDRSDCILRLLCETPDAVEHISGLGISLRRPRNTEARCDFPFAKTVIDARRQEQDLALERQVVVLDLEQGGRFARVHSRVAEVQFSHVV